MTAYDSRQRVADDLHTWSARRLRDALAARELSAVAVLEAHLRRIDATNPAVNAIVTLAADQALEQARGLDRTRTIAGPLHGVPVVIKDLVDTAGIRTTYGSRIHADHVPDTDALMVARLRAAGAVILGKSNAPEFGTGSHTFNEVFGATHNPWALDRSAGGSSGGAAAALAAGMVPLADGSDLGGSLRNPASFCGVVGVRTSPGVVPSRGLSDPWNPHGILGPMARSVDDAALMLSVISGPDLSAPLSGGWPPPVGRSALGGPPSAFEQVRPAELRGLRIAWSTTLDGLPVESEVTATLAAARDALAGAGALVSELEPDLSGADQVFETFRSLGVLATHAKEAERWPELVKPEIHDELRWARALSVDDVVLALTLRAELYARVCSLMGEYDVLAAPAAQVPPFDVSWRWPKTVAGVAMERYYTWMRACSRITATTLPVISVPGGFTPAGLPVGLQLIGRPRGDRALLEIALAVEALLELPTLAPA